MGRIILVTGGARSGKSQFAESYVKKLGRKLVYIATAQVYDGEMERRVEIHQARRGLEWQTFETPYLAEKSIKAAGQTADAILFDCLTLYVSNMMGSADFPVLPEERFNYVKMRIAKLITAAKAAECPVVFVTNEVGLGIVPLNAMAREYRDLAGITNQMLAKAADKVYLTISGLAVDIKKIAENLE